MQVDWMENLFHSNISCNNPTIQIKTKAWIFYRELVGFSNLWCQHLLEEIHINAWKSVHTQFLHMQPYGLIYG